MVEEIDSTGNGEIQFDGERFFAKRPDISRFDLRLKHSQRSFWPQISCG
jgi:hypothetical protein